MRVRRSLKRGAEPQRKIKSESPSLTWAGSCTARPHTWRGVGTKDTKNEMRSPTERPKKKSLGSACYSRARRDRRRSQWDKLQLKASSRMERERILRIDAKGDTVGEYNLGRILRISQMFLIKNIFFNFEIYHILFPKEACKSDRSRQELST